MKKKQLQHLSIYHLSSTQYFTWFCRSISEASYKNFSRSFFNHAGNVLTLILISSHLVSSSSNSFDTELGKHLANPKIGWSVFMYPSERLITCVLIYLYARRKSIVSVIIQIFLYSYLERWNQSVNTDKMQCMF